MARPRWGLLIGAALLSLTGCGRGGGGKDDAAPTVWIPAAKASETASAKPLPPPPQAPADPLRAYYDGESPGSSSESMGEGGGSPLPSAAKGGTPSPEAAAEKGRVQFDGAKPLPPAAGATGGKVAGLPKPPVPPPSSGGASTALSGEPLAIQGEDGRSYVCQPQEPQEFLKRSATEGKPDLLKESLRYRLQHYGRMTISGLTSWNSMAPDAPTVQENSTSASFMGSAPFPFNKKAVPALRCAEREIQRSCTSPEDQKVLARPEKPVVGGERYYNSYHDGMEISNHVFGIALDIDPGMGRGGNVCCGCNAGKFDPGFCASTHYVRQAPNRDDPNDPVWTRTRMTRCWVDAFEKYGYFWLGWDSMQDTMHFEFLGDADKSVGPAQ